MLPIKTYKLKLKILSSIETPIMGDTLFGCICWGIHYNEGEEVLLGFLENFEISPFVISDGFPEGMLPRPLLLPERHATRLELKDLRIRKRVKKMRYVPAGVVFGSNSQSPMNEEKLINLLIEKEDCLKELEPQYISRTRNAINRLKNTVEEGALYSTYEMWFRNEAVIDVYVISAYDKQRVQQLFQWGLKEGYGANKSTGKGNLSLDSIDEICFPENGNRYMALGSFIPDKTDRLQCLRSFTISKFGKLGGHFVNEMNPFKKTFLMYAAGATFDVLNETYNYMGQLLNGVHNDQRIRHHACAPLIKMFAKEDGFNAI